MKSFVYLFIFVGIGLLITVLLNPDWACVSRDQRTFHLNIKNQVRPIAERYIGPNAEYSSTNMSDIRIKGNCVLIGLTDEVLSNGESWEWKWLNIIPNELRPDADESKQYTVFVVHTQKLEQVGYYQGIIPSGQAYRARYDICVIYWPELEFVGTHTIISDPPEEKNTSGTEIGNPGEVTWWIKQLPRDINQ